MAVHARLSPLICMGVLYTIEQVCLAVFRNPIVKSGESCTCVAISPSSVATDVEVMRWENRFTITMCNAKDWLEWLKHTTTASWKSVLYIVLLSESNLMYVSGFCGCLEVGFPQFCRGSLGDHSLPKPALPRSLMQSCTSYFVWIQTSPPRVLGGHNVNTFHRLLLY